MASVKYEVVQGPVLVVELGREFQIGDTFKGSPALASSAALRVVEDKPKAKDNEE